MKKVILINVLLFFSLTIMWAEDVLVSVTDRDLNIPLEGAQLQIIGQEELFYTNSEGEVTLQLSDETQRLVLNISYPGYESLRLPLSKGDAVIKAELVLQGIIQGEELVVEGERKGKSDEEVGVSVVVDKEAFQTTANIGIVEDVMNTIKTLPGVGYTSSWNARPSIRGGYPDEMAATLDGFYVTYPFHWGGAVSIFNPNMVSSAKLSNGVYSARYGRAMSGLLEVATLSPSDPETRIDISQSTISTDIFIQTPLGGSGGLFTGGKVTYLDSVRLFNPESTEDIPTLPYIRDFYTKAFFDPLNNLHIYFNGFFGSDGIGVDTTTENDDYSTDILFDYDYSNAFISGGFDWSYSDKTLFSLIGGYNWNFMDMTFRLRNRGTMTYTDDFVDKYGVIYGINYGDTYSIEGLVDEGTRHLDTQQSQIKIQGEHLIGDGHVLTAGLENIIITNAQESDINLWTLKDGGGSLSLEEVQYAVSIDGNHSLNTAGYLIWESGNDQSDLNSELGLRTEYFALWNDDYDMKARPSLNPRGTLTYQWIKGKDRLDNVSFSIGSGLFSTFPMSGQLLEEEYDSKDWQIPPDTALFNVLGTNIEWDDIWKFKLESYYKYYLNRLVLTSDDASGATEYYYNTDGSGHAAGFDLMLQKKFSRKWDGYLSYSFIWSRFYNPSNTGTDTEEVLLPSGESLDRWYFPYYHRYHNFNVVFNWHFKPGWTFTTIGQVASGDPRAAVGQVTSYPVSYDGQTIQRYGRTSTYSDSQRNGISAPVDIRLSYSYYKPRSKVNWEWYIAMEDILANLYQPSGNTTYNAITGEEDKGTGADFNIGIPIPSFGLKISY
ncbi:TonB-dependent receptor plug domain-containing protein [Spirochaeta cellobiosiphila]|uniref:TonB-dependent receptor plug domain-containing protein n=1 Tax=Spirochaeta cellobiosiphila TaxID=504483 RepID=UPI0004145355|nr:TonB-dependent receptor plug domain-containing protein [Spirochaeta cellobiosiphila]